MRAITVHLPHEYEPRATHGVGKENSSGDSGESHADMVSERSNRHKVLIHAR